MSIWQVLVSRSSAVIDVRAACGVREDDPHGSDPGRLQASPAAYAISPSLVIQRRHADSCKGGLLPVAHTPSHEAECPSTRIPVA
jgi:hypothetical protein